ncbi:hypothetical protein BDN72DRAFT_662067 [Pluteus cervinus]|uniref:Uncharacterized protein n=1 Tax=Pluteus cervinus TaxID=181527 RepID=A0ACD3A0H8_9AGAR|nr:hypothetical protein BDN72DRAFT_662067 [Pluteus cervinus]
MQRVFLLTLMEFRLVSASPTLPCPQYSVIISQFQSIMHTPHIDSVHKKQSRPSRKTVPFKSGSMHYDGRPLSSMGTGESD